MTNEIIIGIKLSPFNEDLMHKIKAERDPTHKLERHGSKNPLGPFRSKCKNNNSIGTNIMCNWFRHIPVKSCIPPELTVSIISSYASPIILE